MLRHIKTSCGREVADVSRLDIQLNCKMKYMSVRPILLMSMCVEGGVVQR